MSSFHKSEIECIKFMMFLAKEDKESMLNAVQEAKGLHPPTKVVAAPLGGINYEDLEMSSLEFLWLKSKSKNLTIKVRSIAKSFLYVKLLKLDIKKEFDGIYENVDEVMFDFLGEEIAMVKMYYEPLIEHKKIALDKIKRIYDGRYASNGYHQDNQGSEEDSTTDEGREQLEDDERSNSIDEQESIDW